LQKNTFQFLSQILRKSLQLDFLTHKYYIPNINIEIGVNDEFVDITVNTILKAALMNGEGAVGEGKIFMIQLEEFISIRAGERGGTAI
jgi:nitrogen regulatory protein PII